MNSSEAKVATWVSTRSAVALGPVPVVAQAASAVVARRAAAKGRRGWEWRWIDMLSPWFVEDLLAAS
jgi:hypothetical protein